MEPRSNSSLLVLVLTLLSSYLYCLGVVESSPAQETGRLLYVVYMGEKQHENPNLVTALHHDTLASVLGSKEAALGSIVYSYRHGFSGFAAMLTDSQAKRIAELPGVLGVRPSQTVRLQTTRSWDFLGLSHSPPLPPSELLRKANYGDDVIIGVIDTGIWPESKSFSDDGYGPVPARWKGACQTGQSFNASHCNRKIIGARWYAGGIPDDILRSEYLSPRDNEGHGTHVASTAAGSHVQIQSGRYGLPLAAGGWARGGAPRARLAIYKVIWVGSGGNSSGNIASILAAIDDAIHDGVDILSLSLGGTPEDSWGSFHAVAKGVTVVYAGGNAGPMPQSVVNTSPWVISVAASTIDRSFPTTITLGDNRTLVGQALNYGFPQTLDHFKELSTGSDFNFFFTASCDAGSLNRTSHRGKIVFCRMAMNSTELAAQQLVRAIQSVVRVGGVGVIFAQFQTSVLLWPSFALLPYVLVDFDISHQIVDYLGRSSESSSIPMVKIGLTRTVVGKDVLSPRVATFSSRGPSPIFPGLLKPDVAAPGVNILAAVRDGYVFTSGTSLATPHVSGIVALLKSLHPDWSPAAIKSAIVTTASVTDEYGMPIMADGAPRKLADPFDFGGGNVNPERAAYPGLVYDIEPKEYEELFHCSWKRFLVCDTPPRPAYHLNLPSISIPDLKRRVTVWRTVTNVGPTNGDVYRATVESPLGVKMEVQPSTLSFDAETKTRTFKVTFLATRRVQGVYTFGSLTWEDGTHRVRIPIAVRTVIQDFFSDIAA